jgi:sterol desaturase/sphingolipid hydroxylase (fatty acid hydroxylase superfamily)
MNNILYLFNFIFIFIFIIVIKIYKDIYKNIKIYKKLCIILLFHFILLIYIASYYDFYKNKKYYYEYKNLKDKLDMLFLNVFLFMPLSLFSVLYISPIKVFCNSLIYEVVMILIEVLFGEIWFYTLHRIAHFPQFYFLHKRHHEVIKPIGCLALYASPFDAIIINLGSIFIIQIIFGNSLLHNILVGSYADRIIQTNQPCLNYFRGNLLWL